jgi:hypothetical protein
MTTSAKSPIWWDREVDATGRPIRADVRAAAHEVWARACARTQAVLGDSGDASGLMETSVAQISRYLDRAGSAENAHDIGGLLMRAFSRALRRYATKLHRIHLMDDISDFAEPVATAKSCADKEDCRLDAEKAVRYLGERGRIMLDLRRVGFDWKEIAAFLNTTDCAVRAEFSREVKKARLKNMNRKAGHQESGGCTKSSE